jgi:K+-sensing histidine kinase KdpD
MVVDLAAEFVWLKAEDVVDAIVAFAHEKDISKIIVGRSRRSVLSRFFRPSTPERFIREACGLDVEVLREEESGVPLLFGQSRPENPRTQ